MTKKHFLFFTVTFIVSGILIGFISKSLVNEKPKVAVVLKGLNTEYWQIVKAGAEKGFHDFNIDGEIVAPQFELEKDVQESLLKEILAENPDVLVVSIIDVSAISILEEFVKKDIPVLLLDTDTAWKDKTSYIGTDNVNLGRKAGALLASELQPGDEVALISGDLKGPISGERVRGAKSSLEAGGIKVAAEKTGLINDPVLVKKEMTQILQKHPKIKGVIATTDIMAISALEAIKEQGFEIPVIGTDGITEMIELINREELTGTVAQNPYDMGYISIETALKVIKGEKVEKKIDSGVDIITKDNAKQKLEFLQKLLY